MEYRTIADSCEASLTEKRSEFIAQLAPVTKAEEAAALIEQIRAKHHKARHHVWAYRLRTDGAIRYSDDGEPQGTGGVPVLSVLQKADLCDLCCVVTRYFGGVLLGASGLTRAYSAAAALAVQNAKIQCFCQAVRLQITMDYPLYGKVTYILPDFGILEVSSQFSDQVTLCLDIKKETHPLLEARLTELSCGTIHTEVLMEHYADFASVSPALPQVLL